MPSGKPAAQPAHVAVGPDTMIYNGQPISLGSEVGALTLLHGALQSAIASVDEACSVEAAYKSAVAGLSSEH